MENLFLAFLITLFAGLSTGIGSALAFFAKKTNPRFLSLALGFSAGVMLYVSFVEIFFKAEASLGKALGASRGTLATVLGFFAGIAVIALIDKLVPKFENPHEIRVVEDIEESNYPCPQEEGGKKKKSEGLQKPQSKEHLLRMGLFSALAIAIHNFPEGLATFAAALQNPTLGISIGVAIAIHNIPEGIAVSVPIYYATGSKKKAFTLSFLSGLSEPLGAVIGYLLLFRFFNDVVFGLLFAFVAGIMVYISLDELLPAAERYGEHHLSMYGVVAGMGVMALSLLIL